jgi:hypothetical protein
MRHKNLMFIATCLSVLALFVGTITPSVISSPIINVQTKTEKQRCYSCESAQKYSTLDSSCESCKEAVNYAINYMKDYVKENINDTYLLWSVDLVILIFEGLTKGIIESGYNIKIDYDELENYIEFWVNKTVGLQMFPVTIFLAKLGAITIGITAYLLSLCNNEGIKNSTDIIQNNYSVKFGKTQLNIFKKLVEVFGLND